MQGPARGKRQYRPGCPSRLVIPNASLDESSLNRYNHQIHEKKLSYLRHERRLLIGAPYQLRAMPFTRKTHMPKELAAKHAHIGLHKSITGSLMMRRTWAAEAFGFVDTGLPRKFPFHSRPAWTRRIAACVRKLIFLFGQLERILHSCMQAALSTTSSAIVMVSLPAVREEYLCIRCCALSTGASQFFLLEDGSFGCRTRLQFRL